MTMRILGTTLIAALLAAPVMADSVSREMNVSVRVLGRTLLTIVEPPTTITVTNEDVRRGYLDLPQALGFNVRSNVREGYVVRFEALPEPFVRAHIRWQRVHAVVGRSHEAWVSQPYTQGTQSVRADVRLDLGPQTTPGTYTWPLQVSAD